MNSLFKHFGSFSLSARSIALFILFPICVSKASSDGYTLPPLPAKPVLAAPNTPNSVSMGDPSTFAQVNMDFPIQSGPFQPTWSSIANNYPSSPPTWLRNAKFGMWVHYGPQASGATGDWYAQHIYQQGSTAYNNHLSTFGHPSVSGYKDVVNAWNPVDYNPTTLAQLYYNIGARFVLVQGVHHDQFDNWNSTYNPWNAVNFGPKRDTMAEWAAATKSLGMRFGVAFHHEYGWWFLQTAYRADTSGSLAGVPYDAESLRGSSGSGTWWQNYDLSQLYLTNLREYKGIDTPTQGYWNPTQGIFVNHLDYAHWYATQWALRMIDVIEQYDPDFIYTDGNSTQPFSGYKTGTGYKCNAIERVIAHFYNEALVRHGQVDRMSFIKFHPPLNGVSTTSEGTYPSGMKLDQPWLSELTIGNWFWSPGISYDNGTTVIHWLLETVSRDGAVVVNVCPNGAGDLDSGAVSMLNGVGQWMAINSEGIYGSRAWSSFSEGTGSSTTSDFRFTVGFNGYLYAYCMTVPAGGTQITIKSLGANNNTLAGPITSVSMLGSNAALTWNQSATGLTITCPATMPTLPSGTAICFKIGSPAAIGSQSPTSLAAQLNGNQVNLSWIYSASAAPATFNVKRATSMIGSYTTLATGLSGTTYTDTTALPGTLYYYAVTAVTSTGESPNSPTCTAILPGMISGSWPSQDIGLVKAAGSVTQASGTFTINGSGADIWNSADAFRYAFQSVTGDFSITARVINMQNTAAWAKAGVMIRNSLDANSTYAVAFMTPSNGFAFQQRTSTGGSAAGLTNTTGIACPYWVRLVRSGNVFSAYYSSDGQAWTAASKTTTINMNASVYAGLEVCSVKDGTLCQAQFDNVSVTSGAWLRFDETSGTTAVDSAFNGWNATLVGSPAWTAGKVNNALSLSGSAQYATLPAGITGGYTNFSMAAWVKLNALSSGMRIFDFGNGTNAYMYLTPMNSATGFWRFALTTSGSGGEQQINTSVAPVPGTWIHVAVTLSGSVGTLYLNGTSVGTNTGLTLNPASLGTLTQNYIGKSRFSDPYLNGLIDEFYLFGRALSASEVASLVSPPAAPSGLSASPADSQITLTWNSVSGATSYNVARASSSSGPYTTIAQGITGTTYTDTGLVNGQTYYYSVATVKSPATSLSSSAVAATPVAIPAGPPTGVSAAAGNTAVTLNWTAAAGSTGYIVQRAPASNGAYSAIATTGGMSYTDTGLTNGTTYYYVISSTNAGGSSANYSSEVSAMPTAPITTAEMTPAITLSGSDANASALVTVSPSVIGHTYQLQECSDLVIGTWQNVGSPQTGTGAVLNLSVPVDVKATPRLYFRLVVTRP